MVEDGCVQCRSGVLGRVVCESAVGERAVWDRSGCKVQALRGQVCVKEVRVKGVVWDRFVCKGVV